MEYGTAVYEYLVRWAHYAAGITWMGFLFYLNFVQNEYLRVASPEARADNLRKLLPRFISVFSSSALLTLFTGLTIMAIRWGSGGWSAWSLYMVLSALLGVLLFVNVWMVTLPGWRVMTGVRQGDADRAASRVLLAARTNLLFSGPLLFFMGASAHLPSPSIVDADTNAVIVLALLIGLLELNGLKGRLGPMATPGGTVASSIALTFLMVLFSNSL